MTALVPLFPEQERTDLHVATWNIRRRFDRFTWPPADRWPVRAPRLATVLRAERPAVLCVQEAMPDQARFVAEMLGETYRTIGHGRNARGQGEGCPIFFDSARLELLDHRQAALSDTPSVAGSMTWGNMIPRILVEARLRDRRTDAVFTVVNTHLDVFSRRARLRGAEVVRDLAAARSEPVLVAGDMNAAADSPAIDALFEGGSLVDGWASAEAKVTPEWDTYAAYREPRVRAGRIDWIGVTPGIRVRRAAIDARLIRGAHPSDHLAVHLLIRLPEESE